MLRAMFAMHRALKMLANNFETTTQHNQPPLRILSEESLQYPFDFDQ